MSNAGPKKRNDTLIGGVVLAGFCALAAWVWLPGTGNAPVTPPTPASDLNATLAAGQSEMAEMIAVTTERPLFHATRQPMAAPETPAAPVAPEPTLTLVGILGDGADRVALVRVSTSPELFRLGAGARLGAWEIISIDTEEITVSKDGGSPQTVGIGR